MAAQCCNGQLWRGHLRRRFRPCLVGMAVGARAHFGSRRRVFLAAGLGTLRRSQVVMAAAELGNRQSHVEPLGVMPGRLSIASR
jgi:hypothetical protein